MARVTLSQPGEDVIVGGADVTVVGTTSGGEVITVVSGNVRFDASFNQGGDTIILPGLASNYTAFRSGGEVIFTRNDGLVTVRVPVGSAGTEIQFDGGDSRTLQAGTNGVTLEGQAISSSSTAPTQLTGGGTGPVSGYTVADAAASVEEGNSGTRLLVFTITLDRPVSAADGPITLNYVTANGTANSASDYVTAAGQVTFQDGQQTAIVSVLVNGDTVSETNETLTLQISGTALSAPRTLTGTILNDDQNVSLTSSADNLVGSSSNDVFFGANTNLGAGDKVSDASSIDSDRLVISLDDSAANRDIFGNLLPRTFGGFTLTNIETFEVTNDSGVQITYDLSGAQGLRAVSSANSSSTVVFDQLTSANIDVIADNITGANADVQAIFQAAATAGAGTTVDVIVNDASVDDIILSTVNAGDTGIENVNLIVSGDSVIDSIQTDLTTLTVSGGGSVQINDALSSTVRTIDASQALDFGVDFSGNTAGVKVTGAAGDNTIEAGAGSDTITTAGGDDIVTDNGGDNTISTGAGADLVEFINATLNKNDSVTLGGDAGDELVINQLAVEADLAGVRGATTLTIDANGASVIGAVDATPGTLGEAAGIRNVNLNVDGIGNANDSLDASGYTTSLTVNLGDVAGTDTVALGIGDDTVRTASFDNSDVLLGDKGNDTIIVEDGVNTITAGQFKGFERINFLGGEVVGEDQTLTLSDANAPTTGPLVVDASGLRATTDSKNTALDETLTFSSTAVTAYSVTVTGGAAGDTIDTSGIKADTVNGGGGNDTITAAGGDVVRGDAGNDTINLGFGNNDADGGDGKDVINLNAGAGNNTIRGAAGDDRIVINSLVDFTAADIVDGGADTDVLSVQGTIGDAVLTSVTNVEVLEARSGAASSITLADQALEAGIVRVDLLDATAADTLLVTSKYTANLTVNSAGGNDTITTGAGADLISVGTGDYVIDTGAGADRIRVSGNELTAADKIAGGTGADTVELDVTAGAVTAEANLTNVTGVERFAVVSTDGKGGDRIAGTNTGDVDNNVLTFSNAAANLFDASTPIEVDARGLTDTADSLRVVIANTVLDSDIVFNVFGGAATTIVEKLNAGIDNDINFIGGAGRDEFRLSGGDGGLGVVFDGAGGTDDRVVQLGGILSDNDFLNFSNVEVLAASGVALDAVLGAEAAQAGIVRVEGGAANDRLTVSSGFIAAGGLLVTIGAGDDTINAGSTDTTITFRANANDLTAADILTGGRLQADRLDIVAGGSANIDGVTRVEIVNVNNSTATTGNPAEVTNLDLGTLTAAQVDGGRLTVNFNNAGTGDVLNLSGASVAAALTVNGGAEADTITTGAGADLINGLGGADVIRAGAGVDTVNGGDGADNVRGELGTDTLNGDAGNDTLIGDFLFADFATLADYNTAARAGLAGANNDVINGGVGDDRIIGGFGGDRLTGGAGADSFVYQTVEDSRFTPTPDGVVDNRDVIVGFVAGEDEIDLLSLANNPSVTGQTIRFNGNFDDFASAQSAVGGLSGDAFLDVVFVRSNQTLYVDIDNNGQLDGNDLQIRFEGLVGDLSAGDVNNPHVVTGPIGGEPTQSFAQSGQEFGFRADFGGFGGHEEVSLLRNSTFDSYHIA